MKKPLQKHNTGNIFYHPIEATAIVGMEKCGKSTLMLNWAENLDKKKLDFVYFLNEEILTRRLPLTKAIFEKFGDHLMPIKKAIVLNSSALIPTNTTTPAEVIRSALHNAIDNDKFIFVDENPHAFFMLDVLTERQYKNYAISMRSLSELYRHTKGRPDHYRFSKAIAGRSDDPFHSSLYRKFGFEISTVELYRCKKGEFYLLENKHNESANRFHTNTCQ